MSRTVSDLGRVGRIETDGTDVTFMVVSKEGNWKGSGREVIWAMVLNGSATADRLYRPGDIGPVWGNDKTIEWLT